MRHVNYVLTPIKLNAAKAKERPYKLADGGGLFVRVSTAGTRTWCYGYAFGGKRKEVTLGQFPEVGVKEARDRHLAARTLLANGEDPAAAKRDEKEERKRAAAADENVFKRFSERFITEMLAGASEGYLVNIRLRLANHVLPYIGSKKIEDVKPRDVLAIMERLRDRPQQAGKVRALVEQIFDHAISKLIVETNPATAMRRAVKIPASKHHRHLGEAELGVFWRALMKYDNSETDPSTLAATRLIVWSMGRRTECVEAKWSEFDLDAGTWDIPSGRMKMRKGHRVYLPRQAVEMLREQFYITGEYEHVFSSFGRRFSPLSGATVAHLFKRLEGVPDDFTPHGLRGTGATILREHGFRRDVVELLLAHAESGVAAAYHHHELAEERREALQHYADTIDALAVGGKVIGLRSGRRAA